MIIGGLFFAIREDGPLSLILVVAIPILLLPWARSCSDAPQFTKMQNRTDRVNQVRARSGSAACASAPSCEPTKPRFGTANADLTETSLRPTG
jgi:ATP-binding cassette subfamily B protein